MYIPNYICLSIHLTIIVVPKSVIPININKTTKDDKQKNSERNQRKGKESERQLVFPENSILYLVTEEGKGVRARILMPV